MALLLFEPRKAVRDLCRAHVEASQEIARAVDRFTAQLEPAARGAAIILGDSIKAAAKESVDRALEVAQQQSAEWRALVVKAVEDAVTRLEYLVWTAIFAVASLVGCVMFWPALLYAATFPMQLPVAGMLLLCWSMYMLPTIVIKIKAWFDRMNALADAINTERFTPPQLAAGQVIRTTVFQASQPVVPDTATHGVLVSFPVTKTVSDSYLLVSGVLAVGGTVHFGSWLCFRWHWNDGEQAMDGVPAQTMVSKATMAVIDSTVVGRHDMRLLWSHREHGNHRPFEVLNPNKSHYGHLDRQSVSVFKVEEIVGRPNADFSRLGVAALMN